MPRTVPSEEPLGQLSSQSPLPITWKSRNGGENARSPPSSRSLTSSPRGGSPSVMIEEWVGDSRRAAVRASREREKLPRLDRSMWAAARADMVGEGESPLGSLTARSLLDDGPLFPNKSPNKNVSASGGSFRSKRTDGFNPACEERGFTEVPAPDSGGGPATPTLPPSGAAASLEPRKLPELSHAGPDADFGTPRPPNFQEFASRFDDFARRGANGHASARAPETGKEELHHETTASLPDAGQGPRGLPPKAPERAGHSKGGSSVNPSFIRSYDSSKGGVELDRRNPFVSRMPGNEHIPPANDDDRVVSIDCGGKVFKTFLRTLHKHPGTLLYEMSTEGGELWEDGALFIDRNAVAFSAVLDFYRTDRLLQPVSIPDEMWHMELVFYNIDDPMYKVPTAEDIDTEQQLLGKPVEEGLRKRVWLLWEDPSSSTSAKVLSLTGILVIIVGVVAFILETHPAIRSPDVEDSWFGVSGDDLKTFFKGIEVFVVCYFTFELVCRFTVTTEKVLWLKRLINWVDIVAIAPFYFGLLINGTGHNSRQGGGAMFVRVFRLARVFRILGLVFKLGKYSHGVRVLADTFRTCLMELSILAVLLIMAVIMISSSMYFCENPDLEKIDSAFESIARSMYFSMVSVTTVGYGDMIPKTMCGEFVACMAGLSGIFVLGLPISIIGVKFQQRYNEMLREDRIQKERHRLQVFDDKLDEFKGRKVVAPQILGNRAPDAGDLTLEELDMLERKAMKAFSEADLDESNAINLQEMQNAMKKMGAEIDKETVARVMSKMDKDGSGTVDRAEFLEFVTGTLVGDFAHSVGGAHGLFSTRGNDKRDLKVRPPTVV
uniref:EF-hand domain-containing protein n=1 Tax=Hemiselmis andersenii TaxID=464988 RepID=A0A6U4XG69_HEMAN